ncbi:MAG: MBL fold metallo-hydrolase [Chloroflexi bacterium]|nr:MBL fold metallo-hydrolase [Chloroflexota bacterium]
MKELQTFETSLGARVYQIPVEAFPGFWAFAYLIVYEDELVLIDAGSGIGDSNQQLTNGILEAGLADPGRNFTLEDLTHVLITHGHIDHFGGLTNILSNSNALVGVHELDRRNLTNYEERRVLILRKLENYLIEAGVEAESRENLLGLYRFTKQLFQSLPVDFSYEDINMTLGEFEFLHVPGHCAGHVVIRLHDILFCGDHILSDITPHQAPEQLTSWTGLDHYLHSLDAVELWSDGIKLALCGHKKVITDLPARIMEIRAMHMERLEMVMEFFRSTQTIQDLSKSLFRKANGYNALLAIEEAGAHVEYLYQRGLLAIDNYDQLESTKEPITLFYKRH